MIHPKKSQPIVGAIHKAMDRTQNNPTFFFLIYLTLSFSKTHNKAMEDEAAITKVQISGGAVSPTSSGGSLNRQGSIIKQNCLCSPTTHAGSFRCRLHRSPSLQRSKSIDSQPCQHEQTKAVDGQNNAVNAQ